MQGVSFVVPVHNGAGLIRRTLAAIVAQADGRPMEIVVVDDCSSDGSAELLRELADEWPLQIVPGGGRGAAAAINTGVRAARFPIICQVDQDVVLQPEWMRLLVNELGDPAVAAAQGYYVNDPRATLYARAMSLDLEQRYAAMAGPETGHVCTGNAAYRAAALHQVGLFDESFGYGYDNDMSYRLLAAGYRLRMCRGARSVHRWREGLAGYLGQQYGFGYGRIDLVAKHPRRAGGDSVSPAGMMAHPLLMSLSLATLTSAATLAAAGGPWRALTWTSLACLLGLAVERLVAGIAAARHFRDPAPLVFPILHLGRDVVWVAAIATWVVRRVCGRRSTPAHSMRPRPVTEWNAFGGRTRVRTGVGPRSGPGSDPSRCRSVRRILIVIPAYNEAVNLSAVVTELRASQPGLDVLVVDDGSIDQTSALADRLDVRWLRFPERIGVGGAMRAGLRYAARRGYNIVVRIDGDGQHRADDIDRLLAPVAAGRADVVVGSRYTAAAERTDIVRVARRALAACLSGLTGQPVTDPTSGFWVLGSRAIGLLAEHHPTGYPEPELLLFLSRNALSVVEVPVRARSRLRGRTSLTPVRLLTAGARVLLAMVVVPLRGRIRGLAGD